jgi:flagellar protein FlaG
MFIQNTTNTTNTGQAPQPAIQHNDRLAGNGAPVVVAPNNQAASVETPKDPTKPVTHQHAAAELQSFVDNINNALKQANKNLVFSVDETSNKTVMKVVDMETGDVIRQIPSKEALAISMAVERMQQGMLIKQKA